MSFDTFPHFPPVDIELVDRIVCKLKSQGIFDEFRKDCLADVDTKPAYQNLQQRVNGTVASFLANHTWQEDLNKTQLRESLRRHVQQGFLEVGVDRIVEQVVNPKIVTVFMPKVEDVVYDCLGIEKPKKPSPPPVIKSTPGYHSRPSSSSNDVNRIAVNIFQPGFNPILPHDDLDPVSPGSDDLDIFDEDPPKKNPEPSKDESLNDTQLSGISDLSSHCSFTMKDSSVTADSKTAKSNLSSSKDDSLQYDNFTNLSEKIKKSEISHTVNQETNDSDILKIKEEDESNDILNIKTEVESIKEEDISNQSISVFDDVKSFTMVESIKEESFTKDFSDDSRCSFTSNVKNSFKETADTTIEETSIQDKKLFGNKESTIKKEEEGTPETTQESQYRSSHLVKEEVVKENKKVDESCSKRDKKSSDSSRHHRSHHESKHKSSHDSKSSRDKEKSSRSHDKLRTSSSSTKDKHKTDRDKHKDKDSEKRKELEKSEVKEEKEKSDKHDKDKNHKDSKHSKDKEKQDRKDKHQSDKHRDNKEKSDKHKHEDEHSRDKKRDSRRNEKNSHSSSSSRKDDKNKDDPGKDKSKKLNDSSSKHRHSSDKSKSDKDKDRKRKAERCSEDVKSKEARRSWDRDSGGGGGKGSGGQKKGENNERRTESGNNNVKQEHESAGQSSEGNSCSDNMDIVEYVNEDNIELSEEKQAGEEFEISEDCDTTLQPTTNAEVVEETSADFPSEVDIILMKINSSIEEEKRIEERKQALEVQDPESQELNEKQNVDQNEDGPCLKKPKIAKNIFEIRKIMQARKHIARKNNLKKRKSFDITDKVEEVSRYVEASTTISDNNFPEENKENIEESSSLDVGNKPSFSMEMNVPKVVVEPHVSIEDFTGFVDSDIEQAKLALNYFKGTLDRLYSNEEKTFLIEENRTMENENGIEPDDVFEKNLNNNSITSLKRKSSTSEEQDILNIMTAPNGCFVLLDKNCPEVAEAVLRNDAENNEKHFIKREEQESRSSPVSKLVTKLVRRKKKRRPFTKYLSKLIKH